MMNRIKSVSAVRYPIVRVEYSDGFAGTFDLTDVIAGGVMFDRLKDEAFFKTVAVGRHGLSFGWSLDDVGHEIDFCPDATRIVIETQAVEALAAQYRTTHVAAE